MATNQYGTNYKMMSHPKNNVGVNGERDCFDEVIIYLKPKYSMWVISRGIKFRFHFHFKANKIYFRNLLCKVFFFFFAFISVTDTRIYFGNLMKFQHPCGR